MLHYPRQINALDEIAHGDDSLSREGSTVDCCHVPLGLGRYVGGRMFYSGCNFAEEMGDPLSFNLSADVSTFPIPNVPAVPNANDLTFLLSPSHVSSSSFSFAFTGGNGHFRYAAALHSRQLLCPCLPALAGNLGDLGLGQTFCPRPPTQTAQRLCMWVNAFSHAHHYLT